MTNKSPFNTLLVPTDFSAASQCAFEWAIRAVDGDGSAVIVLHVLDQPLIDTIAENEFAPREDVVHRMRETARQHLEAYAQAASESVEVDTLVAEGVPFIEILRKAKDFAVDAIVMGKVGTAGQFEQLLFGSTADKVLRGSRHPVIVIADTNSQAD